MSNKSVQKYLLKDGTGNKQVAETVFQPVGRFVQSSLKLKTVPCRSRVHLAHENKAFFRKNALFLLQRGGSCNYP